MTHIRFHIDRQEPRRGAAGARVPEATGHSILAAQTTLDRQREDNILIP